ncbi:putative dehydrogenase [Bacillus mesophilus]|uniref:Gfo/Idh/MocA family oxidoreductase n=1 Tax=Bacillus mesophilus TaxID=1808955 RepID=A0A6M0QE22_9BACI|nr:Gfo/Idh/MocA family oxidoreductase [Bacillus mesophilus]MBM7662858.1 putative dehydrogenase [Bacillus mesophilus]NEY73448.1 Gfo/Idh/MocA family oxidoreductase [Bacillus mesophilus]
MNFAIVGCGHIAKKHAKAILAINDAKLLAICDTDSNRLESFYTDYKAKKYTSFEELLNNKEIDVVNICTPSGTHAALAIKAAAAKKHVILEKPMALTLEDADAIIHACKKNHVKLSIVHPNRFRPAILEMKKAIEAKKFGKINLVNASVLWNRNDDYFSQASWRGTKNQDGGVLMNQAIHNLDLLVWLVGDVAEVQAYADTRLRNIEVEDLAAAIVKFKNGALGVIEATSTIFPVNYKESISMFGESGSAVISGPTANWIEHWEFEGEPKEHSQYMKEKIKQDPFGLPGHQHMISDMIEAVKNNKEPAVTGEDGRKALELVLAIYKAAEQGKTFKL